MNDDQITDIGYGILLGVVLIGVIWAVGALIESAVA